MAGEQNGKAYEAFTKATLESLKKKRLIRGDIFWDQKPEGMTIVPDLTIGTDKDHLHTVLLVTHSGSAKNSDMKYWRNMGELAEAKIQLPDVPKVFNLAFDSVIKENLKLAQAASFDGQLIVGDLRYGAELQQWIDNNLSRFPKDKHEKVTFIHDESKTDSTLRKLLRAFKHDLKILLAKKAPPELDQVWGMERKRPRGKAQRARDTFVRRGLSKLLIFEDLDVAIRLFTGKRVGGDEVPAYAYELGLATRFTSGGPGIAKSADEEIANAIATIGKTTARRILAQAPMDKLSGWLETLRCLARLTDMISYLEKHFAQFCNPQVLVSKLWTLHSNPSAYAKELPTLSSKVPGSVWLIEIILEVIKNCSGDAAGYGYAQMAREVAKLPGMPHAGDRIHSIVLSDWIHRRGNEVMPRPYLASVCQVLSRHLTEITLSGVNTTKATIKTSATQNIVEAKLCTYRGFEPLRTLIQDTLKTTTLDKLRSCFGEKVKLPGQATKTTVLKKGSTLINWQSVSDAGRDHKKKELCGRAVALRYSWDAKGKKFIPRPGVKKLVLVVDGTWRREDLLALARAGWDEIFYPDEMDKLATAIV